MVYLTPQLNALPKQQRSLWPELKQTPGHFVLYGGTALALRFGHRVSVDFDFFSNSPFEPDRLFRQIPYLKGGQVQQLEKNTLVCTLDRSGPVQVSFFGGLELGRVETPELIKENHIQVASTLDIAAAKARVILMRPSWKDYVDMDLILSQGVSLEQILSAALALYKEPYSPLLSLKALTYFDDIGELSLKAQERLRDAVQRVDISAIKPLAVEKKLHVPKEWENER